MAAPVEKDGADVVMTDGRFLGAGSHAEWPEEAVHQDGQLVDVLCLCLHHVEHNLVPLPHALGVRGADVVLDNDLPLSPAQPATHETLHLHSHRTTRCLGLSLILYLLMCDYQQLYLFDLFNIGVFLLLVVLVRPNPFLGFVQHYDLAQQSQCEFTGTRDQIFMTAL